MNICLLLAAGSSSRMQVAGPKMLLPYKGKTLLQHTIDEINKLSDNKLVVVTGCYHSLLKPVLQQQQIEFVQNGEWEKGMGSSIQKGITYILAHFPDVSGVIILVCDQPYLSAGLLQEMIKTKKETGKNIIGCTYNGTIGTPVLFDKKYLIRLTSLSGPSGAKKLVAQFISDTATVAFPSGSFDIDTPEDYKKLK